MIAHIYVRVHAREHSLFFSLCVFVFLFLIYAIMFCVVFCCCFFWGGGGCDAVCHLMFLFVCDAVVRFNVFSGRIFNTRSIIGI